MNENYIRVNQAFECDSTFFEVFDSELLLVILHNIFDNPGSMVVSESFAKKAFGNQSCRTDIDLARRAILRQKY